MSNKMSTSELNEFLDGNTGYIKKGSATLLDILRDKGYDVSDLTAEQVKEALRLKAAGYVPGQKKKAKPLKILTYDIETSFVLARVWGTGQQYVGHDAIQDETQIITVAYKWMGSNTVHHLEWSRKKKNDRKLMEAFLLEYNKADMVIGWNNNGFDNKIINSRAMKHGLFVNTHIKSFDIMRQVKKVFRLPSYSLSYVSKYLGLGGKLQHNGIKMWEDIAWGSKADYKTSMAMMIQYNVQDVALTEEVFFKLRPYLGHVIHVGVLQGKSKITCPSTGSEKVKLYRTTVSAAGVIQRVMKSKKTGSLFKVSNSEYLKSI